jgi:hypothetical protein
MGKVNIPPEADLPQFVSGGGLEVNMARYTRDCSHRAAYQRKADSAGNSEHGERGIG